MFEKNTEEDLDQKIVSLTSRLELSKGEVKKVVCFIPVIFILWLSGGLGEDGEAVSRAVGLFEERRGEEGVEVFLSL